MQPKKAKPGYKFVKAKFQKYEEIPKDWELERIEKLCDLVNGVGFPKKYQEGMSGKFPFFKVSDMNLEENEMYMNKITNSISKKTLKKLNAKIAPPGTIIFPKIGESLRTNKRRILVTNSCFDNNVMGLIPKKDNMLFLYYELLRVKIENFEQVTTLPFVDNGIINLIKIPVCKLSEQKKIASVFSNIDNIIQNTVVLLRETQKLKKGLMQQLFPKGIGHTKFKKVKLGSTIKIEIPVSWETKKMNEISLNGTQNGYPIKKSDYGKGISIVGMNDLFKNDVLEPTKLREVKISNEIIKKFSLIEGDLLFGRRSLNIEGAGKCVMVPKISKPIIFESSIIRMQLKKDLIKPHFVNYLLNSDLGKRITYRIKQTVTISGITSSELKEMKIPLSLDMKEQQKIVDILSNIDSQIYKQTRYISHLASLKKGLMQILLTGKIRTKF